MPFFSVVITAYNAEEYLERALKSVINQSFNDYELIIVENGSSDSTRNIVKRYEKKYDQIVGLYVDDNLGISGGRNYGIKSANGKYVCFLDSDDYWMSNKLSEVYSVAKENEYNMLCHWEYHIHNGEKTVAKYRQPNNTALYRDVLVNGNCLSTSAMTIRTDFLIRSGGFSEKLVRGEEDYDLWLRLANKYGRVFMIKKPLGCWVIRDDSVSSKKIIHTEAVIDVIKNHFDILQEENRNIVFEKERRKAIAGNYCGCGRSLSKMGERRDASDMYKKSLKFDLLYFKSYIGLLMNALHI